MTNQQRKNLWMERVTAFRASGQGAKAWCTANNVSTCQLYYWLKRGTSVAQPTWLPVVLEPTLGYTLNVRIGKATVEVAAGFDPELLRQVVEALGTLC